MDEDELAVPLHHSAHLGTGFGVRSDGCADRDPAVPRDLARHPADAQDVQVPVRPAERQAGRKQPANHVAVQHGDLAPALEQRVGHAAGHGRLARPGQPGEEHGQSPP